jgi:hypothetical protein
MRSVKSTMKTKPKAPPMKLWEKILMILAPELVTAAFAIVVWSVFNLPHIIFNFFAQK